MSRLAERDARRHAHTKGLGVILSVILVALVALAMTGNLVTANATEADEPEVATDARTNDETVSDETVGTDVEPAAEATVTTEAVSDTDELPGGVSIMASYDSSTNKLTIAQGETGTISNVSDAYYYRNWRAVDSAGNTVSGVTVTRASYSSLSVAATTSAALGTYKIQYYSYYGYGWTESDYTVEVTAPDYGTSTSIDFFLNFNALPEGSTSLNNITSNSNVWVTAAHGSINTRSMKDGAPYASDIYNIGVGAGQNGQKNSGQRYIYGGGLVGSEGMIYDYSKVADLNAADARIRQMAEPDGGLVVNATDSSGTTYTYRLGSVPSDAEAIQEVQDYLKKHPGSITINGKTIPAEAMTTANFVAKWYVIKDVRNGFHVDGYLVAKTAYMKVTKSFGGNNDAINAVKGRTGSEAYSIYVAGSGNTTTPVHDNYSLTLTPATDSSKSTATSGNIGYDPNESDPDNNTYVWYVPVDYQYDYALTEQNWQAGTVNGFTYESTASSTAVNSADSTTAKTGNYAITVRGTNSASSLQNPLTVGFQNIYTPDGTVVIHKVDSTTGRGWAGVEFKVTGPNGEVKLSKDATTGYYTVDNKNGTTSTVSTDQYGMIYLKDFPTGTYTLTEVTPTGYNSIGAIAVTISSVTDASDSSKNVSRITAATYTPTTETPDDPTELQSGNNDDGYKMLQVTNTSKTAALKAQKVWNLKDGEKAQDVTLGFLQNGNAFGAQNMIVTVASYPNGSGSTSAETAVTDANGNMIVPLYIEGKLADYTAQELKIGSTSISEGSYGGDGYQDYNWTQATTTKTETNADGTTSTTVLVTVTNEYDHGDATFTKVDDTGAPVAGATFTVYGNLMDDMPSAGTDDPTTGMATKATATSAEDTGAVTFAGLFKDSDGHNVTGFYYMKETGVPAAYDQSATSDVYLVQRTFGGITVYRRTTGEDGTASWQPVAGNKVVNNPKYVTLTIQKELKGKLADTTKEFTFTVTGADGSIKDYTATTQGIKDSTADSTEQDGMTASVTALASGGQSLKLKYGDKVTIKENDSTGYTTKYALAADSTDSGTVTTAADGTATVTLTPTKANADGVYETKVVATNTKTDTPVTGITTGGVPRTLGVAAMVALAIAGAFALAQQRGLLEFASVGKPTGKPASHATNHTCAKHAATSQAPSGAKHARHANGGGDA